MRTSSTKVARRYARALITLCDERGDGEQVRDALGRTTATLAAAEGGLDFLGNPTVPFETRRATLVRLLDGLAVQGTARDFVQLLLDKGRIAELPRIKNEFDALLDARSGRVQAGVLSAIPLQPATQERLRGLLERLLARKVVLDTAVEPDLLGGLVIRVGNTVYDASVRNHLDRLRDRLVTD